MKNKKGVAVVIAALVAMLALGAFWWHGIGDTIDGATPRDLPNHFSVKERAFFKWGDTFDVEQDGTVLGTVQQEFLHWTKTIRFDDNTGKTSAVGSIAVFSWGTQIDIKDGQGHPIGAIKEEVFSSLLKTWTTYRVLDADGKQIATSEKSEFFSTSFELKANDGHVVAVIHRPTFNWFGDNWEVTIKDASVVDPRIDVLIAAFKTSADNDKKKKDDEKKHKDDHKSSSSRK